ncbi:LysR family transcriptional regulator [Photobacterium damselae subsp. damselae]|uniref:LysR family transcriptional regulator n=1 Tax=Photobacterium damselae TaxID=38293 RepID=UPI002202A071|nr:LysR family transcriptional regulator [Photobacterium damselae]BDR36005.1 LysR family transcriptional regulator [Photobacterium damselae subsp. damselae]
MISIEALRCFISTVQYGSFSSAAEKLNMSVSSISRYVKILEEELNTSLLIRNTRSISLTETGKIVYEQGQVVFSQINRLSSDVNLYTKMVAGQVKICAPMWYSIHFIAPLIPKILEKWPKLNINLISTEESLNPYNSDYDLYITMEEDKDSWLISKQLRAVNYCLCASPTYLSKNKIETIDDLNDVRLIKQIAGYYMDTWVFKDKNTNNIVKYKLNESSLSMNCSLAIKETIINDTGVGLLPVKMIESCLAENKLCEVLDNYHTTPFQCKSTPSLIYLKDKSKEMKVKVIIDFLMANLS